MLGTVDLMIHPTLRSHPLTMAYATQLRCAADREGLGMFDFSVSFLPPFLSFFGWAGWVHTKYPADPGRCIAETAASLRT